MDENRFDMFVGLLGSAAKSIQRLKATQMEPFRLSAAHTDCLCSLAAAMPDGLTQAQLAQRLAMDRAQISRVLRDLRAQAYVLPGGYGYKIRYRLTDAGRRLADESTRVIREITSFVSGSIPREELESFYRTFTTIATNLVKAVQLYDEPQLLMEEDAAAAESMSAEHAGG